MAINMAHQQETRRALQARSRAVLRAPVPQTVLEGGAQVAVRYRYLCGIVSAWLKGGGSVATLTATLYELEAQQREGAGRASAAQHAPAPEALA